jgi:hypothetical protein
MEITNHLSNPSYGQRYIITKDLSYNDVKRGKTPNAMSQETTFSDNSQCNLCFYEMYWLANDLHALSCGTSHKLVFRV